MLNLKTLDFLKELKLNNSKEWLEDNRADYESVKNDILALTTTLIESISDIDATVASAYLDPKKCITRLNRDLRFAKDKTPYKTDYYIVISKNGKNSSAAFYYLHIEPENCFVGGGLYNPQPEELKKIRQEIDYSFEEWENILIDKEFKSVFVSGINNSGMLSKVPKEFKESNKASTYLKMKGFYTAEKITDKDMILKDTIKKLNICFKTVKPLVDFLNKAIEN